MTLKTVIEALVFASPKPLLTKEIVGALRAAGEGTEDQNALDFAKAKEADVLAVLEELQADFAATGRAFQIVERVNGWSLVSDAGCAAWVRQLYPEAKPTRLTGPQLETLAIIAYRQPVTRADIEAVRGVAVDGVMQVLLDRGLVKIAGRAEVPGRPLLYSTTEYFLQHFGLKTTDDLPNAGELKRVVLPTAPAAGEAKLAASSEAPAESTSPNETPVESGEATEASTAPAESAESAATEEPPAAEASVEPDAEAEAPEPTAPSEPAQESEAVESAAEPPANE